MMTAFPTLSDEDIHAIFDYVDNQGQAVGPEGIPDFQRSLDSCRIYNKLKSELTGRRDSLIIDNGKFVTIDTFNPKSLGPETGPTFKPENLVAREDNVVDVDAVYYKVNIKTFGWFNVDMLMANLPGFENSELMVKVTGDYKESVNLFLLLPNQKTFLRSGPLADKTDEYGFYTDDGQIPLPQNAKAYLLAMGEYNGQLYFYETEFKTQLTQSFTIQLSPITKEKMNQDIVNLNIDGFEVNATDSKNADTIRKIDARLSEIEKLKPLYCDCNCGLGDTVSAERIDSIAVKKPKLK